MIGKPLPAEDIEHVLAKTQLIWEPVRGRRIFITGGTGFFGRWLIESFLHANRLLSLGAEAVVLSRDPEMFLSKAPHLRDQSGLAFHRGDVRNFDFPDGPIHWIIAGATTASAKLIAEEPQSIFDTILDGTRHTLEFAKKCGAKRFLFISSGAVYGRQPTKITNVDEDFMGAPLPTDPGAAYGEAKRAAELLCLGQSRPGGLEISIARCFAFVGPLLPLDGHFAIGNFIRDGFEGKVIQVNGDGTPYRSYLYASDLAIWLWTILARGTPGRPYNVGSPAGLPLSEIAKAVADSFGNLKIQVARTPDPAKAAERYVPSVVRAEEDLALKVSIGLPEALRKTLAWHRISP